jgi:DNA polymerase alpha subunit B
MALSKNLQLSPSDMATHWEVHSLNQNIDTLNEHTFNSFRSHITSTRKATPRSSLSKDTIVSPNSSSTTFKRGAVIHRSGLGKRSIPSLIRNNNNNNVTSPSSNKGLKRKVDFDSQLEHVVNTNNGVTSPLADKSKKSSTFSPSSSSQNSAVVTPSKSSSSTPNPNLQNAYDERKNAGEVIVTYNPHKLNSISSDSSVLSNPPNIQITKPYSQVEPYKYMTDKNRSHALNTHLSSFQMNMVEYIINHKMTDDEKKEMEENGGKASLFEYVGVPRQGTQFNIGRICNEAHEGKMNKTTILLEGTKNGSNGARIELDVSKMDKSYSLFPGQIVGVKGINSSGRKMVVEEIIEGMEMNLVKNVKEGMEEMQMNVDTVDQGNGAKIFVAAGPYTTNQNLQYQPLFDLLISVTREKPSVVIMMGPFVDLRQDKLKDGDQVILEEELDESVGGGTISRHVSYETLFAAKISQSLEGLFEEFPDLNTKFILVPSLDDAVSEPV